MSKHNSEVSRLFKRFFGQCPLCTHRPRVVAVEVSGSVTYRRAGTQSLTFEDLCGGCGDEIADAASDARVCDEVVHLKVNWKGVALALID